MIQTTSGKKTNKNEFIEILWLLFILAILSMVSSINWGALNNRESIRDGRRQGFYRFNTHFLDLCQLLVIRENSHGFT